jgi:hypothetical protein
MSDAVVSGGRSSGDGRGALRFDDWTDLVGVIFSSLDQPLFDRISQDVPDGLLEISWGAEHAVIEGPLPQLSGSSMPPGNPSREGLEAGHSRAEIIPDLKEPVEMVRHEAGAKRVAIRCHQSEDLGRQRRPGEDGSSVMTRDDDVDGIALVDTAR